MLTRRTFLGAAAAAGLTASPLGLPIGCQTYPVKDAIGKDFDGTLRDLAAMGFQSIELCSPQGYAKTGYGALLGSKPAEIRNRIHAAGLVCDSCHYQIREFREPLDETIAYAKELGLKQMVLSTFSLRNASLADWSKAAQELNRAAAKIQKAGMQTGFHNHNVEFDKIDGVVVYDRLMSELDPGLVKMQFQTWVASMGVDPVEQVEKYPGRVCSLHLQDFSPQAAGPEPKGMTAIGQGVIDWKRLFKAARKAGVKNYYVEMDPALMKASVPFLRGLKT